jgi:hypothetical protein
MPRFDHWLITRFNVPMRDHPGRSTDAEWLAERIDLFRAFCLPSVALQNCQDFRWLLMVDDATPPPALDALRDCERVRPFETLAVGERWRPALSGFVGRGAGAPYLMTSRLDSDDAIGRDYLGAVRGAFDGWAPVVLEAPSGLRLDARSGALYHASWRKGAFLTLIEGRSDRPLTVYARPHMRMDEVAPLRAVPLEPAWVQVVHGGNAANRVGDDPVPAALDALRGW